MSPPARQPIARPVDRVLNLAENVVYAVAGGLRAGRRLLPVSMSLTNVPVLAVATYLVRRKEREPEEDSDATAIADTDATTSRSS